jgi:hypothetical protein
MVGIFGWELSWPDGATDAFEARGLSDADC